MTREGGARAPENLEQLSSDGFQPAGIWRRRLGRRDVARRPHDHGSGDLLLPSGHRHRGLLCVPQALAVRRAALRGRHLHHRRSWYSRVAGDISRILRRRHAVAKHCLGGIRLRRIHRSAAVRDRRAVHRVECRSLQHGGDSRRGAGGARWPNRSGEGHRHEQSQAFLAGPGAPGVALCAAGARQCVAADPQGDVADLGDRAGGDHAIRRGLLPVPPRSRSHFIWSQDFFISGLRRSATAASCAPRCGPARA